ncbi:MAG: hypothetical protein DCF16_03520 [Alphaproteobacteria bacterium]|jgi:hypothetical protein|nr:MAG: hypothetical protein DCF16_03520 [Alphaproteobacteria bacterium]
MSAEDGREAKLQAAKLLRDAGFAYLAANLEHGSLSAVAKDEPFFLLCGRDRLAPTAIKAWIEAARISNVPDHKLESAHETIEAIEGWPGDRHYPD